MNEENKKALAENLVFWKAFHEKFRFGILIPIEEKDEKESIETLGEDRDSP